MCCSDMGALLFQYAGTHPALQVGTGAVQRAIPDTAGSCRVLQLQLHRCHGRPPGTVPPAAVAAATALVHRCCPSRPAAMQDAAAALSAQR